MPDKPTYLPARSVKERATQPRTYFNRLREEGQVVIDDGTKLVMDDDLMEPILMDYALFSSKGNAFYGRDRPIIPQQVDPPLHSKYRRVLQPLMSIKRMNLLEPGLVERTNGCIDAFIDKGGCELREDLAVPVPAISFVNLMGLPIADIPFFLAFKDAVLRPGSLGGTVEVQVARQKEFAKQNTKYFTEVMKQRRKNPGEDLISAMINTEISGERLDDQEILDICFQLPLAGMDTVGSSILLGFAYLAGKPEYQHMLATRPEIIETAIEEILRWESPVNALKRLVTRDTIVGGCPLSAGERLFISTGAANYSEKRFEHADTFDMEREPNRHWAFGTGPHTCVGNNLARVEMRVVLREWHRRIPRYRIKPGRELDYSDDHNIRTIAALPLEWNF